LLAGAKSAAHGLRRWSASEDGVQAIQSAMSKARFLSLFMNTSMNFHEAVTSTTTASSIRCIHLHPPPPQLSNRSSPFARGLLVLMLMLRHLPPILPSTTTATPPLQPPPPPNPPPPFANASAATAIPRSPAAHYYTPSL
jgi:hypothetical protein